MYKRQGVYSFPVELAAKIAVHTVNRLSLIDICIKMATDGLLRGLGIMRPFLVANMVNLAIRLSVALICAPDVYKRQVEGRVNNMLDKLQHMFGV